MNQSRNPGMSDKEAIAWLVILAVIVLAGGVLGGYQSCLDIQTKKAIIKMAEDK
jgi:hypothetical protein